MHNNKYCHFKLVNKTTELQKNSLFIIQRVRLSSLTKGYQLVEEKAKLRILEFNLNTEKLSVLPDISKKIFFFADLFNPITEIKLHFSPVFSC